MIHTVVGVCPYGDQMFVRRCRYLEDYRDHIFVVKSKVTNMKTNGRNGLFTRQSSYGSGDGVRVKDKRFGRAVVLFDRQPSYGSGEGGFCTVSAVRRIKLLDNDGGSDDYQSSSSARHPHIGESGF